jgi:hypothetical protein
MGASQVNDEIAGFFISLQNNTSCTFTFEELLVLLEESCFSSSASRFIIWHLPLQCSFGRLLLIQRFLEIKSWFTLYSATTSHLLKAWASISIINIGIRTNFIEDANISYKCFGAVNIDQLTV